MTEEVNQARWVYSAKVLEPLIFEKSYPGRIGYMVPTPPEDVIHELGGEPSVPKPLRREKPPLLPEVSELQVVRHYTRLSQMNFGVDQGFYPLGSCTMKYNPKICEKVAQMEKVTMIHPYQDPETVQGALELMYNLSKWLSEIGGVYSTTLQPAAGAHGEFVGMLLIRAYHAHHNQEERNEIIVPDTAHGTNPASASQAGYRVVVVPSNSRGCVDLEALEAAISDRTAGLMLTNPNTLGLFEEEVEEIARLVHDAGGLLYYDGANLNAIIGRTRPGDMGFDIVHFNLHKTFSTPHGGGGPGAGPVGVVEELDKFLPVPVVVREEKEDGTYFYRLDYDRPHSIGKVRSFYGNFGVLVRAYVYLLSLGLEGLREAAEVSVLNANYVTRKLERVKGYELPFDPSKPRKHECVFSVEPMKRDTGVSALDVAKRLLDHGLHSPTNYFPLIVREALMIEPTETEPREELDRFVEVMERISREAYTNPERVKGAPHSTAVRRLDQVKAAKKPVLSYRMWKKVNIG